ncbi:unnamed protein product [Diatraea saccharalis]|uniref:PHD-type domain-containing protein n=1 Tax=Diatraea saccharalis TaxID=40085 RepID=A0A9P0C5X7_9NEOP|nr:unnamed protein product [Diatraea saccharalis]
MSSKNCSGCHASITNGEYLQCRDCNQNYDILCANFSLKRFSSMTKENKLKWTCDACRNKHPKRNNQETPVRFNQLPTASEKETLDDSYVTLRPKRTHTLTHSSTENNSNIMHPDGNELSEIIGRQLKQSLREEMPELLKKMLLSELKTLSDQIAELTSSVEFLNKKYDDVHGLLKSREEENKKLRDCNEKLQTTVSNLSKRVSTLEQHGRENNIEIHGLPEHRTENIALTVMQIGKVVSQTMEDGDIMSCFRVAKANNDSTRPRTVVVKFRSNRCRDALLAAVSNYNKKNKLDKLNTNLIGMGGTKQQLYISEHLSPEKKSLHAATRIKAKELSYRFTWIRNGKIYVWSTVLAILFTVPLALLPDELPTSRLFFYGAMATSSLATFLACCLLIFSESRVI